MRRLMKWKPVAAAVLAVLLLGACGKDPVNEQSGGVNRDAAELTDVKVVLDWTPNTNHTGLYVALDQGFYEQEGLRVQIVQPGTSGAEAMVATGEAEFGVSYQETVTQSRIQGVPLVSIAAVIQHNTSGFASAAAKNITRPKDFEGKIYSAYGSPTEEALIASLMQLDGGDPDKVNIVHTAAGDFFTSMHTDIDFALIYYAWTGVEANLRGEDINIIYLNDYSDSLDFYTPVLISNESMIKNKPDIVRSFMAATTKGYELAIEDPEQAARILLKAEPDLDEALVVASQEWLASRYQDDAPRWGEQKRSVWENYANWMLEHGLLEKALDVDAAFTNDFLPESR